MAPIYRENLLPTRTLSQLATAVLPRQTTTTTVVATDGDNGGGSTTLSAGAIAGIVIGSIAGFLLLLWIIRSCSNLGRPGVWGNTFGSTEKLPTGVEPAYVKPSPGGHSRHHHGHHHDHHHRSRSRHHDHSPRRSFEVRNVTSTQPVYVGRGRSPRAPQPVYYATDTRREGRGRRTYYG